MMTDQGGHGSSCNGCGGELQAHLTRMIPYMQLPPLSGSAVQMTVCSNGCEVPEI